MGMPCLAVLGGARAGQHVEAERQEVGPGDRDVLQARRSSCAARAPCWRCRRCVGIAVQPAQHLRMVVGEPGVGVGVEADHARSGRCGRAGSRAPAAPAARPRRRGSSVRCGPSPGGRPAPGCRPASGSSRPLPASRRSAEIGGGVVAEAALLRRSSGSSVVVVEDHRLAVGRQLDVELDAVAGGAGGLEGAQGILRRRRPGSTARGGRSAGGTAGPRPRRSRAFIGPAPPRRPRPRSSAAGGRRPTAERACRPASPNTSTIRSEQPFTTWGMSKKSGPACTKPPSFTTRTHPVQVAVAGGLHLGDQVDAADPRGAGWPSPRSTSSPTTPRDAAAASIETWPEMCTTSPARTNGT